MKTDVQLQKDVQAELEWEPSVDAARIGVTVHDGVVTLGGHVRSFSEKWDAERAAQRVAGVRALAVEIDVALPGSSRRNDVDIARSAQNVLQWMTYLPNDAIRVLVEDGWLTLTGEVGWGYQRQAAVAAVRHLLGVTGVSDQIVVAPKVALQDVKADIESALRRRSASAAQEISVDVRGADVTLRGTVHSWSERDLAAHTAWGTPGVRSVIDKMTFAD
jgi:osmotically-inducible protein OsmY